MSPVAIKVHAGKALLKPSSSQQVRSKFFNMIGIESSQSSKHQRLGGRSHMGTDEIFRKNQIGMGRLHPRAEGVVVSREALKYNDIEDRMLSIEQSERSKRQSSTKNQLLEKATDGGDQKKKKNISFHNTVDVVPIPMRTEYSDRVRTRLWSNAVEIHENAARNQVEFAAEGWDWRTVTEDDKMYVCCISGELIHPVHYARGTPTF
mmetsp:Transcript_7692/g.10493  ORF Transcript_7692/g.10493 Transcript_7692/m.10493 type:complete len:206 (-) Transcript_7692:364-981(-)|eukprot:CAMPEP_0185727428 /NCGR_PEP_ID=MMETSP1171-20130828/3125_1 /TAXON_ID=374046 /ORGANISM="Helicotheca tamensis, Strain CCMP826" /LENGTH=205 /DNA_ID=CAMNT_0028396001 /DNA_START=146 /DNA_END=763 /DNA_ORIENTATION=+